MELFDIKGNKVTLNAQALMIPAFKKLWDRDTSTDKEKALKEISYIVFKLNYNSPYQAYKEEERERQLKKDFFGDLKWNPDTLVKEAFNKYRDFHNSPSLRMLEGSVIAAEELADWLLNVKEHLAERDRMGKPITTAKDIVVNLEKIGNVVKSLAVLKEQVEKEQLEKQIAKGGNAIGAYEL
jgi:hypothetical protein